MMKIIKKYIVPAVVATLVMALITGIVYPLFVTGVSQVVFPNQANGSPIVHDGKTVGSGLIGQNFTQDRYFHGRPSAAGSGYDAMSSGGSNLAPSNPQLYGRVWASANESRQKGDVDKNGNVPVDAVTASGSGLDPDITLANALEQVPRVAKARNMTDDEVRGLVSKHVKERDLGVLGEPRVNVLELNLALDDGQKAPGASASGFGRGDPQMYGALQAVSVFAAVVIAAYLLALFVYRTMKGHWAKKSMNIKRAGRLFYRLLRIDPKENMDWKAYLISVLAFSFVSFLFTYIILRGQGALPLNPQGLPSVGPDIALNTAVSFGTNTNWQVYSGEQTMSYLSQMLALTFQNFMSAAVGMAVALALMRGITNKKKGKGLGNFWVDMTRLTMYVLIPISIVIAIFFVSQGVPQTFNGPIHATTLEGANQTIPVGPVASQESIKMLGTNGGGFFNANSAHPYENPNPLTNAVQIFLLLLLPMALLVLFGKMAGNLKQGWVLFVVVLVFLVAAICFTTYEEQLGNVSLHTLGVDQSPSSLQSGGNMEGKEVRFGIYGSTLFAIPTTAVSCGAVNSMHDSYTPLGGMVPMILILVGEVVPGGAGSGFFSLFMYIIITIFIAGLMVGRTPSYLGKKIATFDMKMTVLILISVETTILVLSAIAVVTTQGTSGILNSGPHGLSEVLYAYGSGVGNNGSAFAGLNATNPWYIITMVVAMFIGRFFIIIPMLAIAGSFANKAVYPSTSGTLPTDNVTFGTFLIAIIAIIAGLTFLPILVLGPILEHLIMIL